MADGVMITVTMHVKPDVADAFISSLPESIADTASFPGFRNIRVVRNKDNPNLLMFVENWDRESDYHAYVAWRSERGEMENYRDMAIGDIEFNYWPVTAVSA